jgi:DNA-binding CsgD family transcriptional regulator
VVGLSPRSGASGAQRWLAPWQVDEVLVDGLSACTVGKGVASVLCGEPGIGKTSTLARYETAAERCGVAVASARCKRSEQRHPFGVVRQLFEPVLSALSFGQLQRVLSPATLGIRHVVGVDGDQGIAHDTKAEALDAKRAPLDFALYRLTLDLARSMPLTLVVDDAHFADTASLSFLEHLVRRLAGVPAQVVLTTCWGVQGAHGLLGEIAKAPGASVFRLAGLSAGDTAQLLGDSVGPCTPQEVEIVMAATMGNPALITQLVEAATSCFGSDAGEGLRCGILPRGGAEDFLAALVTETPAVAAVADAVAILDGDGDTACLTRVSELEPNAVAEALTVLRGAHLIKGDPSPRFVHPIVRDSLLSDMGSALRSRAECAAVEALMAAGADVQCVARHLIHVRSGQYRDAVRVLRAASHGALRADAADLSVRLLRRALEEAPDEDLLGELLLDLGWALFYAGDPDAQHLLQRSVLLLREDKARRRAALRLAHVLGVSNDTSRALEIFTEHCAASPAQDGLPAAAGRSAGTAAINVLSALCGSTPQSRTDLPVPRALPLSTTLNTRAACTVAELFKYALHGTNRQGCRDAAVASLLTGDATSAGGWLDAITAVAVLSWTDDLELAAEGCATLAAAAPAAAPAELSLLRALRADVALRGGQLATAARAEQASPGAPTAWDAIVVATRIRALVEQGLATEASHLLGRLRFGANGALFKALQLAARAEQRCATGNTLASKADWVECGRQLRSIGVSNPAVVPWRSRLSMIVLGLGDATTAERLAAEEVHLATVWGAARPLGIALRAQGLAVGGSQGLEILRIAAGHLTSSGDVLDLARTLTDLGVAELRARNVSTARDELRRALDIANDCGAVASSRRAHRELLAAGAKPRRTALSGFESLTPSERRTVKLAAEGRTNSQIATGLFVGQRTVEIHLSNAYRKLGIAGRSQLLQVLPVESMLAAPGAPRSDPRHS